MLAAPDKVLKATPGSIVKDTGQKIADSDMPLYFPCACRAGKYAQLMRLHVVTPKAPVYCTLNPKVSYVVIKKFGGFYISKFSGTTGSWGSNFYKQH